jgi:type IV pilus assembly protein PilQ
MTNQFSNSRKLFLLIIPMVILFAWFAGCASNKAGDVKSTGDKRITAITTRVTDDSVIVEIAGNQPLTYTAIKQVFPMGVLFHFPETSLEKVETVTTPTANEIIGSVKATELVEDKSKTSRVFIALKADAPYDLKPQDTGLQILFPRGASPTLGAAAPAAKEPIAQQQLPPETPQKTVPEASRLESVTATALKNNVVVNVKADGTIKNFKSFTIDGKDPRIVFDIYKIHSPFDKEQRLTVQSKWIRQVRHFGYPDKVRLVLETQNAYLDKYSASPTDNGLLIYVGSVPATAPPESPKPASTQKDQRLLAQTPKSPQAQSAAAVKSGKPAWVNRIDFSSEEAGKSALIIGTTVPVQYDLKKVGDKRLQLTLFNTSLPDYRKRALITTRFESAVDRVTPIQTPEMKGNSLFTIELREDVPYFVEQQDDTLRIRFAASSIPPKPYENAALPEWKKVLAETPVESAKPAEGEKAAATTTQAAGQKPAEKAALEPKAQSLEERLAEATSGKKYTGEKIALDFFDTDIKNVFRILREISGKNFAIDKNVTGKVTLTLEQPVPWDQVLDLVLKMNQLGMTMEGDIVRIATLATLAQEDKLKQAQLKAAEAAQKQAEALEPLFTEYIPVSYANAKTEVLPLVTPILTKEGNRGSATVDERNNQLIITDTATKIRQAKQVIEKIDTVTAQVIIEARIVEANTNFSRDIGFDWGTVSLGAVDIPGTSYKFGPTTFLADNVPLNFPSTGSLTFNLFKTAGTPFSIVDAQLAAREVEGKTNIISSPKIVTLDNKKATIKQGFEYPYEERDSSGNATVRFKDIDLLLEVTPSVTSDNRISMTIFVTKNEIAQQTSIGPALSTNEATTEILVDDGDTIVIGGVLKSTITWNETGIPGLRKMGVLGWLFKLQNESDDKNELLIFMTPRIVKLEQKRLS